MTPGMLIEKVATGFVDNYNKMFPDRSHGEFKHLPKEKQDGLMKQAESAIRIVLTEIEVGGIVDQCDCLFGDVDGECKECADNGFVLTQPFKEFMEAK